MSHIRGQWVVRVLILSLDVDDVCSRCWEFQLDVHTSNGISSVKGSLGKCVDFGGKNCVLLHGL